MLAAAQAGDCDCAIYAGAPTGAKTKGSWLEGFATLLRVRLITTFEIEKEFYSTALGGAGWAMSFFLGSLEYI